LFNSGAPDVSGGSNMSAPAEVPEDIVERIRTLCLALPEVTVRIDGSPCGQRSDEFRPRQLSHL
jgi:hypothetical protein